MPLFGRWLVLVCGRELVKEVSRLPDDVASLLESSKSVRLARNRTCALSLDQLSSRRRELRTERHVVFPSIYSASTGIRVGPKRTSILR